MDLSKNYLLAQLTEELMAIVAGTVASRGQANLIQPAPRQALYM